MKNKNQLLIATYILFIFCICFYSCKKDISALNSNFDIAEKVTTWLNSQKSIAKTQRSSSKSNKDANIDLLNQNLDFDKAITEVLDKDLNYLIIPIKEEIKQKKNLQNNSTLILMLIMDKIGTIKAGDIVYYLPGDGKQLNTFSANTFQNIFKYKEVTHDGTFRFLV